MAVSNGITVRVKSEDGRALEEVEPKDEEPRNFRYRPISAIAGSKFEISVTVEKRFDWKGADCIFIAIAYDDGKEERLGETDYTMAWAISKSKDYLGEHVFSRATRCEKDESVEVLSTTYEMPAAAIGATKNIEPDKHRHRSKDALVSHRSCVSVYVHRGHLSLNPEKRRLADPISGYLYRNIPNIATIKERRLKINFESFTPLQNKHGNVCEFHFRNINPAEFATLKKSAPPKSKARDNDSSTSAPDRSDKLDAATARKSQGLRGLPQRDYSQSNIWEKHGYPWNESENETPQEEMEGNAQGQRRYKRPRVVSVDDDEDDEESVVQKPQDTTKSEPRQEEQAPAETIEEQHSASSRANTSNSGTAKADDEISVSENKSGTKLKEKRGLEMELEDIELERRALKIKRRLLEFEN
ncbi:hypothetical protein PRZ48_003974 [Zasmidium cellare]|uniref:Uncharacterized protein n=1 Tax=Zasmidium cellare TaxID=395010 RepID=A0ABR0EXC3_ZASCE|nr:hypothetical protein PRZ48_003974 [Zasmidium cellare]